MKWTLILSIVLLTSSFQTTPNVSGSYTEEQDGGRRLYDYLTLFPDSTYQYSWWTDIIMTDEGKWTLKGDTLTIAMEFRDDILFIFEKDQLFKLYNNRRIGASPKFKKTSSRCDTIFWED